MITLKFPSIDKALLKSLKGCEDDDPRRGIIVLEDHAIVVRNNFVFVINLYEYFTIECGVMDSEEIDELKKILFFMNGRIFNADFWSELNKGANMQMKQGSLFVQNPQYSKDLHHNSIEVNLLEPLEGLLKASLQTEKEIASVAIPFSVLNTIYSCLSAVFKEDSIIFEFSSQSSIVKFTFKQRKHCFGFIRPDYDAAQEGFRFDQLETMMEDETILGYIEEWTERTKMAQMAPPPPPPPVMEVVKDDKQGQFFDGNGN